MKFSTNKKECKYLNNYSLILYCVNTKLWIIYAFYIYSSMFSFTFLSFSFFSSKKVKIPYEVKNIDKKRVCVSCFNEIFNGVFVSFLSLSFSLFLSFFLSFSLFFSASVCLYIYIYHLPFHCRKWRTSGWNAKHQVLRGGCTISTRRVEKYHGRCLQTEPLFEQRVLPRWPKRARGGRRCRLRY